MSTMPDPQDFRSGDLIRIDFGDGRDRVAIVATSAYDDEVDQTQLELIPDPTQ